MKYLKILPVVSALALAPQGVLAIKDLAVQAANQAAAQQQAAAQILGQRNARLTHLNLPNTDEYRTALIANGDHNGGATAGVIVLHVKGIAINPIRILAADAILGGGTPDEVTARNVVIAGLLQSAMINLPVNEINMKALDALQKNAPPIAVNVNNISAAIKLSAPDAGPIIGINADSVAAADALLRAVGGPLDVSAVTVGHANALLVLGNPVIADTMEAYGLLRDVALGGGGISAQKVMDVVGRANLLDKKAAALLSKMNKFQKANQAPKHAGRATTYMEAAQAFAANDAAWSKATKADLRAWIGTADVGRAQVVTDVANR